MEYAEVSIRVTLPAEINSVIMQEKQRFVSEYGSNYKSESHITLYLGRYTEEGFPKLIEDLQKLKFERVTFSLLGLKVNREKYNNSYVVDVSNKEELIELHKKISRVASSYQSPLVREREQQRLEKGILLEQSPYAPHITLGNIPPDAPQPNIEGVEENIKGIVGKQVTISDVTVFFYGRRKGEEKPKLVQEVKISF